MNAIVALCHFCETHGPSSVFCTQTLRDTKIDEISVNLDLINNNCQACNSIGNKLGYLSRATDSNANFLSTQVPVLPDVAVLVKQAAVRSLSCEVNSNKDGHGGFVFFGDATRGHVLSHTFQIIDSKARGFYRLFSITIIMKDKLLLLNIQPFLSENIQNISRELQNYASLVNSNEQSTCSQRAQRLNSGQVNTQASRSLVQLTGEQHIFAQIHSYFTWILWAGARYLTESITLGSPTVPPWLSKSTEDGFSLVQLDKEDWLINPLDCEENIFEEDEISFRYCKELLRADFLSTCYCVIVGIQVILRGPQNETNLIIKCLKKLLPEPLHKLIRSNCVQYFSPLEYKIISVMPEVAVPQPSQNILRIDLIGDTNLVSVKWLGDLPNKWPDLLIKINKAMEVNLFTDLVLEKHIKVLVEEWKNKVKVLKKNYSNHDLSKLKKILGAQHQDQQLINYWGNYLL